MTIRQGMLFADSVWSAGNDTFAAGQTGNAFELLMERLAALDGVGPLLSSGFRGVWMNTPVDATQRSGTGEWTMPTGGHIPSSNTNTWARFPQTIVISGHTAGDILKFKRPKQWRPGVGFALYIADLGHNGQYSIDNGATWTNFGQAFLSNDSKAVKFYVNSWNSSTDSVWIRGYNGTVDVNVAVGGIEIFFVDPTTATQGIIGHNVAMAGDTLHNMLAATAGDKFALADSVKIDPINGGGAFSPQPNLFVGIAYTGDYRLANPDQWYTIATQMGDLQKAHDRLEHVAPQIWVIDYEFLNKNDPDEAPYWDTSTAPYTEPTMSQYRDRTRQFIEDFGVTEFLDLHKEWSALGLDTWSKERAQGWVREPLLLSPPTDAGHPMPAGAIDIQERFFQLVANSPNLLHISRVKPETLGVSVLGTAVMGGIAAFGNIAGVAVETDRAAHLPAIFKIFNPTGVATETDTAPAVGMEIRLGLPVTIVTPPGSKHVQAHSDLHAVYNKHFLVNQLPARVAALENVRSDTTLGSLSDVAINPPIGNAHILAYRQSSNQWVNVELHGDALIDVDGLVSLSDTGVTPGTYGGSSSVAAFEVDSKGRITGAASIGIAYPNVHVTGDVTGDLPGVLTIADSAVTLTKMAQLPAGTIIGNNTGGAATPIALTSAQVATMLGVSTTGLLDLSSASSTTVNVITATTGIVKARYYGGQPQFQLLRSDGNVGAWTPVLSGEGIGVFGFGVQTATNPSTFTGYLTAYIQARATENASPTAAGSQIVIATTQNGTHTGVVAITVDQDQSVTLAGAATITGAATLSSTLGVTGLSTLGSLAVTGLSTLATLSVTSTAALAGVATFAAIPVVNVAGQTGLSMIRDAGVAVGDGTTIGAIIARGALDTSHNVGTAAAISFVAQQASGYSTGKSGGRITFQVSADSTSTLSTATIGIDNTGKLYGGSFASQNWSMTNAGALSLGGDLTMGAGNNIVLGTSTGTKLGTAANQKLGLFGVTPIVQPASPSGNVAVGTAGATNAVFRNTTFTGGLGSTAYTFGDVVLALKQLGALAA